MNSIIIPKMVGRQLRTDGHWSVDGLVFYPDFSGDTGKLPDLSPYGNAGVITGAEWQGEGLSFSNDADKVSIPDATVLDIANTFTVVFWANVSVFSDGILQAGSIITKFDNGGATNPDKRGIRLEGGAVDLLLVSEQVGNILTVSASEFEGEWHQFVVTSQSSGSEIFIDAISKDTGNQLTDWFNTNGPLRFGDPETLFFNSGGVSFNGIIGSVSFYSRALSASEIQALFINPDLPIEQDSIWRLFSLDVGSGIVPIIQAHNRKRYVG